MDKVCFICCKNVYGQMLDLACPNRSIHIPQAMILDVISWKFANTRTLVEAVSYLKRNIIILEKSALY